MRRHAERGGSGGEKRHRGRVVRGGDPPSDSSGRCSRPTAGRRRRSGDRALWIPAGPSGSWASGGSPAGRQSPVGRENRPRICAGRVLLPRKPPLGDISPHSPPQESASLPTRGGGAQGGGVASRATRHVWALRSRRFDRRAERGQAPGVAPARGGCGDPARSPVRPARAPDDARRRLLPAAAAAQAGTRAPAPRSLAG